MAVSSLGYISLVVTDLEQWRSFATGVIGLMPVGDPDTGDRLLLKMDDHPYRLSVVAGDEDRLACAGWEFSGAVDYEAAIARLEAAGVEVHRGDAEGAGQRCVTEYASATDPAGNPFELYHGRTACRDDFKSPAGVSHFVTGAMGMGHLVVPAPNMDETHDFYTEALGFGDSDDLRLPPPAEGAPDQRIIFMHADNPRHHSLALYNFPVPSGIIHMIFEMPDIDQVGLCLDRAQAAGLPLMGTLGRHCNDRMLSFYGFGPGGIGVEVGCDGLQIDWSTFTPTVSTQGDVWGHAYAPVGS